MHKRELIEKITETVEKINECTRQISTLITGNESMGSIAEANVFESMPIKALQVMYIDSLIILNGKKQFLSILHEIRLKKGGCVKEFAYQCKYGNTFELLLKATELHIQRKDKS